MCHSSTTLLNAFLLLPNGIHSSGEDPVEELLPVRVFQRRSDLFSSFHLAKYSAFGIPFTVFDMEIEQQSSVEEKEVHPLNPESNSEKDVNPSFPFVLRFHCLEQNQTMK